MKATSFTSHIPRRASPDRKYTCHTNRLHKAPRKKKKKLEFQKSSDNYAAVLAAKIRE